MEDLSLPFYIKILKFLNINGIKSFMPYYSISYIYQLARLNEEGKNKRRNSRKFSIVVRINCIIYWFPNFLLKENPNICFVICNTKDQIKYYVTTNIRKE